MNCGRNMLLHQRSYSIYPFCLLSYSNLFKCLVASKCLETRVETPQILFHSKCELKEKILIVINYEHLIVK